MAQEQQLRGVRELKSNPIIPPAITKTGFRANKAGFYKAPKYQPFFRAGKSSLKSKLKS
jgi:hypothetical protein